MDHTTDDIPRIRLQCSEDQSIEMPYGALKHCRTLMNMIEDIPHDNASDVDVPVPDFNPSTVQGMIDVTIFIENRDPLKPLTYSERNDAFKDIFGSESVNDAEVEELMAQYDMITLSKIASVG